VIVVAAKIAAAAGLPLISRPFITVPMPHPSIVLLIKFPRNTPINLRIINPVLLAHDLAAALASALASILVDILARSPALSLAHSMPSMDPNPAPSKALIMQLNPACCRLAIDYRLGQRIHRLGTYPRSSNPRCLYFPEPIRSSRPFLAYGNNHPRHHYQGLSVPNGTGEHTCSLRLRLVDPRVMPTPLLDVGMITLRFAESCPTRSLGAAHFLRELMNLSFEKRMPSASVASIQCLFTSYESC
jgi:hypothetical protein